MKFQENIPIYVQIAVDIKAQIIAGTLAEGDKLLSIREYSLHYAVTALTMQRAMGLLEVYGILQTKKGVGSFVEKGVQMDLKNDMITKQIKAFITQLSRIGLSGEEILDLVKEGIANG